MQLNITDRIKLMISEQGFTFSNWIYIDDEVQAILEAGMDEDGLLGVNPAGIDQVLLSHHHMDHTRGMRLFPQAQRWIHALEADVLRVPGLALEYNALDLWPELMPGEDLLEANAEIGLDMPGLRQKNTFDYQREVKSFTGGETFDFGTTKVQVLHLPGHSVGHCCFFFPEEDFFYSSDICLTRVGPWYGEHLADPWETVRSIDKIIDLAPARLVSSHIHKVIEDPIPRLREFKSRIEAREERIYQRLRQAPADIHSLAPEKHIYPEIPTNYVLFWEKLMLLKHLESLEKKGLVHQEAGVFAAI